MLFSFILASSLLVPSQASEKVRYETIRSLVDVSDKSGIIKVTSVDLGIRKNHTLVLSVVENPASNAIIVVEGKNGQGFLPAPDVKILSGYVDGYSNSLVAIGVGTKGVHGLVRLEDEEFVISTGSYTENLSRQLDAGFFPLKDLQLKEDFDCKAIPVPQGKKKRSVKRSAAGDGCRTAKIAIDTDYEYTYSLFGGDQTAASEYAAIVMGIITEIYQPQVKLSWEISYLRLWSSNDDPYSSGTTSGALNEMRSHWISEMSNIERDVAHLFSGRGLGGGVAWLGVMCDTNYGYAVSADLNGSFPTPWESNQNGNWDLMVIGHELGHNCGTGHTHDSYSPPIDGCGNGDCSEASNGTIMSYCHLCSGGISNMALEFHPLVEEVIKDYLDGTCLPNATQETEALNDYVETLQNEYAVINVLENDRDYSCNFIEVIESFDSVTLNGGDVEVNIDFNNPGLRYTPPLDFSGNDSFVYVLSNGSSAIVSIDVLEARQPDVYSTTEQGCEVAYYDIPVLSQLPDFEEYNSIGSEIVTQINEPSTNGVFMSSGLSDDVGAVFNGYIIVPQGGAWTFYLESDDGSKLYIGDELLVSNDGTHPMVEEAGSIALAQGGHAFRVDFFERGGGAGIIVRWEGPETPKQVIPLSGWGHGVVNCSGDVTGDQLVNLLDVLAVIEVYGTAEESADLDEDGIVSLLDLLEVISAYGNEC